MKTGIDYISIERERQINEEGYSEENDLKYTRQELCRAAASYACPDYLDKKEISVGVYDYISTNIPDIFPFDDKYWKPTPNDRVMELSKAGALIAAEIDRILNIK